MSPRELLKDLMEKLEFFIMLRDEECDEDAAHQVEKLKFRIKQLYIDYPEQDLELEYELNSCGMNL